MKKLRVRGKGICPVSKLVSDRKGIQTQSLWMLSGLSTIPRCFPQGRRGQREGGDVAQPSPRCGGEDAALDSSGSLLAPSRILSSAAGKKTGNSRSVEARPQWAEGVALEITAGDPQTFKTFLFMLK